MIRPAQPEDVGTLLQLIKELAAFEHLENEVVATEEILREHLFGKRLIAEALIAEKNDEAAGFALFFHNFSTFLGRPGLYLEDLYVRPRYRGEGFGIELLAQLAKIAKERSCGRMEWWVLDWNKKAIALYERLGAKPMKEWTVYRLTEEGISDLAQTRTAARGGDSGSQE
jgi:GNAT superfamily N-acetyltransferase